MVSRYRDQPSESEEDEDDQAEDDEAEDVDEGDSPPESARDPLKVAGTLFAIDAGVEVILSGIDLHSSLQLDWTGVLLTSIEVVVAVGLLRSRSRFRWPGVLLMLTFLGNSSYWAWLTDAEPRVWGRLVIILTGLVHALPFALLLLGRPSRRRIRIAIGLFVASTLVSLAASVFFHVVLRAL